MLKILIPVDGSDNATRVLEYAIRLVSRSKETRIHLITVRDPMDSLQVHRFWTAEQIHAFQQEAGDAALQPARKRLDEAGISYTASIEIGEIAQTITEYAKQQHYDMIIMGTRGMGTIGSLLMGSVATKVVHLASIPVTLVK
jgi:nucleotide-binding universal stress UspA family protein